MIPGRLMPALISEVAKECRSRWVVSGSESDRSPAILTRVDWYLAMLTGRRRQRALALPARNALRIRVQRCALSHLRFRTPEFLETAVSLSFLVVGSAKLRICLGPLEVARILPESRLE